MPGKNSLAGTVTAKGAQLSDNQRNNSRWAKEVTIGQQIVFFATAVSFAAGAADMSSGAVAAGFGNFGILLILIRTYFSVPLMVAGLRARDVNWAEREERRLISGGDLAWTALVGRGGKPGGFQVRRGISVLFFAGELDKVSDNPHNLPFATEGCPSG